MYSDHDKSVQPISKASSNQSDRRSMEIAPRTAAVAPATAESARVSVVARAIRTSPESKAGPGVLRPARCEFHTGDVSQPGGTCPSPPTRTSPSSPRLSRVNREPFHDALQGVLRV